jgi:hypothetical protein
MISSPVTDPTLDRDLPPQADQPGSQPATARFLDGSRELVDELRSRLASHDAASARRRESLAAELARQESLWAAKEEPGSGCSPSPRRSTRLPVKRTKR